MTWINITGDIFVHSFLVFSTHIWFERMGWYKILF